MVTIVEPSDRWAGEFLEIAATLRDILRDDARRIDHIGSTSVPRLPSKDVIDVQVTVVHEDALERVASALADHWWRRMEPASDHHVPGLPHDDAQWHKAFFDEPEGERATHVHVRVGGRANQRYALLFRDYLREHPDAAAAYAEVKRGLAVLAPDSASYADAKDPACDLIYVAAQEWAAARGWQP
jgi:GrpB-like predicted nucleotidyltransferase (UPF0157 family)